MRRLRFFLLKYRPVFIFIFVLGFLLEQGYVAYLVNHKDVDESPKSLRMTYSLKYTTKDKFPITIISTINYNKNGMFWSLFSSEKKIKNCFNQLLNEETRDMPLYDLIQEIENAQNKIFKISLYNTEQQCNIDIYDYQINISINKKVFDKYIIQRQDDEQFKKFMLSASKRPH